MIRLQDYTPEVYYRHSRDFQFIGRLYDIVLNSVKTNTDLIYSLPISDKSSTDLLDLMSMTFGFHAKHNYNVQQLKSVCAAFAKVIRNKGNIQAIKNACNAVMSAEGIAHNIEVNYDDTNTLINVFVPQELSDINLLEDLLDYILPAGCGCRIIRSLQLTSDESTTNVKETDSIVMIKQQQVITSQIVDEIADIIPATIMYTVTYGTFNAATITDILNDNNIKNTIVFTNSEVIDTSSTLVINDVAAATVQAASPTVSASAESAETETTSTTETEDSAQIVSNETEENS